MKLLFIAFLFVMAPLTQAASSKAKKCGASSNQISCKGVSKAQRKSFCWKKSKMAKLTEKRKESICRRGKKISRNKKGIKKQLTKTKKSS